MHLLIVSATPFEIAPLRQYLEGTFEEETSNVFTKGEQKITLLITGVGMTHTALNLGRFLVIESPDLVINAGIAGSFSKKIELGAVVQVISERFADLGVEEADGRFTDVHEMDLLAANEFPFEKGQLMHPEGHQFKFLPTANGLTVNKVHGTAASISALKKKYAADIETMEGAAFFLACMTADVSFLAIRSISNFVEPRNRAAWDLPLAIGNLNAVLVNLINVLLEEEVAA